MRIDLHCHTKKVKTGDAYTRNVTDEVFGEKIMEANVKIVAITNHNQFDFEQYMRLKEIVNDYCDVWPGVELDIEGKADEKGKSNRGHLIVIANPKNGKLFNDKVLELINDCNPDDFIVDVHSVYNTLNECDVLYIPHFHKEPRLSDTDIQELDVLLQDKSRLFKETSDYRSLGVFSNFDYSVIIGSDVQDWKVYEKSKFAEIRLPIQTFEQFCLLAKKDKVIIDTLLNQKKKNEIEVFPHKNIKIKIPIYEDVNVIFGQKGTGKSEIINSLCNYYEENSVTYQCYIGNAKDKDFDKLLNIQDIKRDSAKFGIDEMKRQFLDLYEWQDKSMTPFSKYVDWWKTKDNNRNKSKMKITDSVKLGEEKKERKLDKDFNFIKEFFNSSFCNIQFSKYLTEQEIEKLNKLLEKLGTNIEKEKLKTWEKEQSVKLTNWSIDKIKHIADKCSNTVSKPSTTGFYEYAMNRFALWENIETIQQALNITEQTEETFLGTLEEKGDIYIQTKYKMLEKKSRTEEFRIGINKLKECKQIFDNILKEIALENLVENISRFRELYEDGIKDITQFIGVSRQTVLRDKSLYKPSNGERGILLLQKLLDSDSDIYLLDEPELGMGNSYITSTILPKIVNLAKQRKTVVLATHNANLAVATLPYVSILRTHKNGIYSTYVGNPFCDELKNIENEKDVKNWTKESMHTLEGGRDAFYGRRDIYESGRKSY